MKSRYAVFQCNKCDKSVGHNVVIAENESEFERLSNALTPPFAELSNNSLVKQFDCLNENCDGYINVVYVETSY